MEPPTIDWGMEERALGLVDWRSASRVGRSLTGSGPSLTAADRAAMREELSRSVTTAESLVADFTGLEVRGPRPRAWTMSRGEWSDANLHSIERVIEPMVVRTITAQRGRSAANPLRSKALGAQLGALFGYISRKVLGQFDPFLPPDDEGLIYFVGPNVAEAERRFAFDRSEFRLYLALHEVTHRVQFSDAVWLRGHILTTIDSYLSATELDPRRLAENVGTFVEELRSGRAPGGIGFALSLMTPEQRELFHRVQATMSLIEGHASFVMNGVGRGRLKTFERMKRTLAERRRTGGLERAFQQVIGFDHKIKQYGAGERFVTEVVERAGMEGMNLVWRTPLNLPGADEIGEPGRWLARVA